MRAVLSSVLGNSALMTLVGICVGALAAGIFPLANSWISFEREDRLRRKREQREALREVNLAVEKGHMAMQALWPPALKAFVEGNVKEFDIAKVDPSSPMDIQFLLGIYAPDLLADYDRMEAESKKFANDWFQSLQGSVSGTRNTELLLAMTASLKKLTDSTETFRSKLVVYARKHCS